MMDYRATEKIENEPIETGKTSLQMIIQETNKIVCEMNATLTDFESIVTGSHSKEEQKMDVCCLYDEARMMAAIAYECLQKLKRIRNRVIS